MATNSTFDPFQQSFTLVTRDGIPFNVTIPEVDAFILYSTQICINYGAQIGACIVLLVVLLLLTKAEKRGTPIFIINVAALVFDIIRNVLECLYFTGPFSEMYAYFGQDYSRVHTGDYASSVTATVLTLLVLVCVEISLCLQVRVVCITLKQIYRRLIFASCIIIALMAIGIRLALMIENDKLIVGAAGENSIYWLTSGTNIMTSISICWFCVVFVIKLGFALYQRRKLGLRQFGPMQVIFIMGCQTLVIPCIFSILQYFVYKPALDSNVITSVAIFLPLSSLWASSTVDGRARAPIENSFRREMFGKFGSATTGPLAYRTTMNGTLSPSDTATTIRVGGSQPPSPHDEVKRYASQDLEEQGLAGR